MSALRSTLMNMICGNWLSQCIYVTVKLKLADYLSETTGKSIADLSQLTNSSQNVLSRLIAILCEFKLCEIRSNQVYLTQMGMLLQSNNPDSLYAYVILNQELYVKLWGNLLESVHSGEPAFRTVLGSDFFSALNEKHPKQAEWYDKAMDQKYREHNSAIARKYKNFSLFKTVIDIGGGQGSFLEAVLKEHPNLNGVLFDLPDVISRAKTKSDMESKISSDRLSFRSGDFFDSLPETQTTSLYVLKAILHDWNDEKAAMLLGNCKKVMKKNDALLIIEKSLTKNEKRQHHSLMDMHMFLIHGGGERTLANLVNLITTLGFDVDGRIESIGEKFKLIEARPKP